MKLNRSSAAGAAAVLGLAALGLGFMRSRRTRSSAAGLAGKVVLITGGSRGLGFAMAREFAGRGASLALTSRNQAELENAKARLVDQCGIAQEDIFTMACDIGLPHQVNELVAAATAYFGRVDIVVNNAGIILVGPLESHTLRNFEEVMRINFFGAVHTTLAVLPQMVARGAGAIINIASVGGKVAVPHMLPYVASKFALVGWSQGMHTELAPRGVRVLTVNPGVMRSGSHIQAKFTGDAEREYRWFASAATMPLIAVDAGVAAKKIVHALLSNSAETSIGLQALVASRLSNLAPEVTAAMLSLANRFLPHSPAGAENRQWDSQHMDSAANAEPSVPVAGASFRHSLPKLMQHFGEDAIRRYNQEAG